AVSSGYYDGYGSAHHYNWTRQSFAHNTVTIDGAGQLNYSHDSGGFVDSLWRDSRCCYFRGDAGRSYGADRVARYRRHVLFFFDRPWFVLLDELELVWPATVQWHVHSFEPIEADESGRRVRLRRGQAGAEVALLYHLDGYARTWEGFDPPPSVRDPAWRQRYYKNQYHYRFGTGHSAKTHRIAAVFVPTARRIGPAPPIKTSMDGRTEIARLRWPDRQELLLVGHGQAIDAMDFASDALLLHASMDADGQPWQIDLIEGQHVRWRGQAPTCPVTLLPADRR
ncbi:MAG: heparinase II/III family protein, partial [Phycisphaerae bacterium]